MVGFHEVADLRHDRSAYNGDGCGEYWMRERMDIKGSLDNLVYPIEISSIMVDVPNRHKKKVSWRHGCKWGCRKGVQMVVQG